MRSIKGRSLFKFLNCKLIIIPEITMTSADSEAKPYKPKMWETPHLERTAGDLNLERTKSSQRSTNIIYSWQYRVKSK